MRGSPTSYATAAPPADVAAAVDKMAEFQVRKLQQDLQEAQDTARENVEAAVVLTNMQQKGLIHIDEGFNVTLSQTGEKLNIA